MRIVTICANAGWSRPASSVTGREQTARHKTKPRRAYGGVLRTQGSIERSGMRRTMKVPGRREETFKAPRSAASGGADCSRQYRGRMIVATGDGLISGPPSISRPKLPRHKQGYLQAPSPQRGACFVPGSILLAACGLLGLQLLNGLPDALPSHAPVNVTLGQPPIRSHRGLCSRVIAIPLHQQEYRAPNVLSRDHRAQMVSASGLPFGVLGNLM